MRLGSEQIDEEITDSEKGAIIMAEKPTRRICSMREFK